MKWLGPCFVAFALLAGVSGASAHEAPAVVEETAPSGNVVEASGIVRGTVSALKGDLYRVERWPEIFSDARSLTPKENGVWSIHFERFGHPHDFRVTRTAQGVVLELAMRDHGEARLEYRLEPIDATHSKLTVRLAMPTPPGLGPEQARNMMHAKARVDVGDFSKRAETYHQDRH